jgi:signal transduction histidine kinase
MTQLAAREEEKLIGGTRQLLLAMAESAPVRNGNRVGCKKLCDELFSSYRKFANLGVVSTNGEILASADPPAGSANQADHLFFRRVLETRAFAIGDFPAGPVIGGKPTVNFGYPVFDRFGQIRAVVFAALDLSWFGRLGSELPGQLPRQATWTELTRAGTILFRYPAHQDWIGKPLPEKSLLNTMLSERNGLAEGSNSAGVPYCYAFATMQSPFVPEGVITVLGIPRQTLFGAANHALLLNLGWLGIAASLAFVLGWLGSDYLIVRPIRALVESSTRLTSGDLSARTGLPHERNELGQLTMAFDLMAQSLEQRELERKHASNKVQVLSHKLVEVQESERRSIARELHDEIGQSLTVAEMNLQAAMQSSGRSGLTQRLKNSIEAVEKVLEQVHDITLNLRPSMLDDLGLEPALRWCLNRQAAIVGMRAEFRADPLERRLDGRIETECFRVAQEALTNVVRHSQAGVVTLHLTHKDGLLHLSVRDDGIGFDVAVQRDQAVRGKSLGLLSMQERAALAGGGLEYLSAPGQGTEVHAWFPLKWQTVQT